VALLLLVVPAQAQSLPGGNVSLQPQRWRPVRQVIQKCADQAQFRWAMPDTLSRRAWTGSLEKKEQPIADILQDIGKQTGLTVETINGVLVVHAPKDAKRKELAARLADKDSRAARQALAELAWLSDARAWPELAKVAAGADAERALAAAQALRRLEGERPLDWRLFGISNEDPEFVPMAEPVVPWQVPLGAAFPDSVSLESIDKLAASTYIPLREAAARLAACQKTKGKTIAEKLAGDPSPTVRAAAERTLVAWAEPKPAPPAVKKPDGQKPWWEQPRPDFKGAAEELALNKDHDTVWRLVGRRVAYQGTPEAIKVMLDYGKSGGKWSGQITRPLAEWCGGPEVVAWLKSATVGDTHSGHQGWGLWGLSSLQDGEELAQSLRPALEARAHWAAPPEFTAARGAGIHALPPLLARMETRGHWVCLALGHVGGPEAIDALLANIDHKDPGVATAAAKGAGDACALAAVPRLAGQLKNSDRLRRHWAVLALGKIGGPDAAKALTELLVDAEQTRKDRLVRKAAAALLREIGPLSEPAEKLVAAVEADDRALVPEYRPRNLKFGDDFPVNTEVTIKEHNAKTYSSIGETRAAMDWANRLMFRYGGCSGCYSNECFAFDVGTGTWFPIRAADHYCHLFNEVRPIAGCSRGMTYDGVNKLVWIGHAIGSYSGPTAATHNLGNCLGGYDAALDRFYPCANATTMAKAYSGEPAKFFAFDYDAGLVVSSASGGLGIGLLDAKTRKTYLAKGPDKMPSMDQYRPPAFAYDPVAKVTLCTHPGLEWKLLTYDTQKNGYRVSESVVPGKPSKQILGGLVYDSLNRAMILVGGIDKGEVMPTCVYDRQAERWLDLQAKNLGQLGKGLGTCVYDPEHNVILELHGGAYRYKNVAVGTKAFYGGGIGKAD
jgi:HEAT repeat protein